MRLGLSMRQPNGRTLIQRAIASLRARGSDAHLWLPGGDVKTYGAELVVNGDNEVGLFAFGAMSNLNTSAAKVAGVGGRSGFVAQVNSSSSSSVAHQYNAGTACQAGKSYLISVDVYVPTGGVAAFRFFDNNDGSYFSQSVTIKDAWVTVSETRVAKATDWYIGFGNHINDVVVNGAPAFYLDNISVREITSITPTILNGLTTGNYLESTGNTVATVDNPTGLVLDALGSVGVELNAALDFTGWTPQAGWSVSSGVATATAAGGGTNIGANKGLVSGATYEITVVCSTLTAGSWYVRCGFDTVSPTISSAGSYTFRLLRGSNVYAYVAAATALTATFTSISVREVSGIHLTQGTTANKAVLRRGLVNLLTYSKTVGGTSWALLGGLTSSGLVTAPDGTNTANTFLVSGSAYLQHNISGFASGASGTVAIWAKQSASGAANGIRLTTNNASAWSTGISQYFPLTPTWQLIVLSGVLQTGGASTTISYGAQLADASSDPNCYGNVDLVDAGCFLGTYTASEILAAGGIPVTTTAAASNPDAGRYSWSFDGSNDSLALGSVPFQMGDDHCVIAGARCDLASGDRTIFIVENGVYRVAQLRFSAGVLQTVWNNTTAATTLVDSAGYAFSDLVGSCRQVGSNLSLRRNGVIVDVGIRPSGSEVMTSAKIGVGNTTELFTGNIGPVLAIKGTVTDAELLMYERLVAALTPGAPSF